MPIKMEGRATKTHEVDRRQKRKVFDFKGVSHDRGLDRNIFSKERVGETIKGARVRKGRIRKRKPGGKGVNSLKKNVAARDLTQRRVHKEAKL